MSLNTSERYPILYSFRRCPYAMRARMALYYAGITVELREIILRDKPVAMIEASPKGTVPVLVLADGRVIDESFDIMRWALAQDDPDGWLNADSAETDLLIKQNDGMFKNALDRYKYPNRYPDEDCTDAQKRCEITLKDLNSRLENHDQLLADRITMSDIALFPFIRQCAFTDKEWFDALPFPYLQNWLGRHINSVLFQSVMGKYSPWSEEEHPLYWGRKIS